MEALLDHVSEHPSRKKASLHHCWCFNVYICMCFFTSSDVRKTYCFFTALAYIFSLTALKSFVFRLPAVGDPSTLFHC